MGNDPMIYLVAILASFLLFFFGSLIVMAIFFRGYQYKFATAFFIPFIVYPLDVLYCYSTYLQYGGHSWPQDMYPLGRVQTDAITPLFCDFYVETKKEACPSSAPPKVEVIRRGGFFHQIDIFKFNDGQLVLYGFKNSLTGIWTSEGLLGFRRQFYSEAKVERSQ
jgi:hypothetical protein